MLALALGLSPVMGGRSGPPQPAVLLSSAGTFPENIASGAALGTLSVVNVTGTPAYTLTDSDGTRVALTGANLTRGATAWDYETHPLVTFIITVTGTTPAIAARTFTLNVTNVLETILAALGLSPSTVAEGAVAGTVVGAITGKTSGSSLTLTDDAGGRFGLNVVPGDPYFSSVVYLSGYEGADGSTTIVDEATAKIATAVGNAQIDTAQFKFGSSSLLLDGNGDYLSIADSPDWTLGLGQFTIEGWFRFAATPTNAVLIARWTNGFAFWFEAGNLYFRNAPTNDSTKYAWAPALNTWYHIACDRNASNVFRIYVDGVMQAKTASFPTNIIGSGIVMAVGSLRPGGFTTYDLNGWVDDVRITKGVARYASDSGYTVPTAPAPRGENTVNLVTTSIPTDYETSTLHAITIRETHPDAAPRDTALAVTVTNVAEATLAALTLSNSTVLENSVANTVVGAVQNRTAGSFLVMPDDAGSRFAISGANVVTGSVPTDYETATSHSITIREIFAEAINSPRDTVLTINVSDVAGEAVPPGPFTLAWTSAASELTNLAFSITPSPLIGDVVVLTLSVNSNMSAPFATSAANTIDSTEAAAGSISFTGITTPLSPGLTYARVNVNRGGLATDSSIASITLTGAAPAWSPLDLGAKLMVFCDPNVPASITGNIAQLNDLSPNADHLANAFAGQRPTLDANGFGTGLEGILFDGVDDNLLTGNAAVAHPGTSKITIASIAKKNPATSPTGACVGGYRGTGAEYYTAGSAQVYLSAANTLTLYSNGTGPSATVADNTRFRFIAQCNGTAGRMLFNGAVTTNTALGGQAMITTGAVAMGASLGSSGTPTAYWGGHIGPLIICNDVLTTPEETSLDTWLAAWPV
jgi:hypothetical protein